MKKHAAFIVCLLLECIAFSGVAYASDQPAFNQQPVVAALEKISASEIQIYLYSLDPSNRKEIIHDAPNVFYGFPILGKVEIKPLGEKEALLKAFIQGVKESNGVVAACFEPRHGLRVIQGDKRTDFVICYTCLSIDAHGFGSFTNFLTSGSPETIFNQFLDQYHITKAKPSL
jgi:hypothetical protein